MKSQLEEELSEVSRLEGGGGVAVERARLMGQERTSSMVHRPKRGW